MKEQVRLDGLLFTSDAQVLRLMNTILDSFAIQTEVCTEVGSAVEAVTHRRLDAVIVDWNVGNDPTRVVRSARKSSPNCKSTIVALVDVGSETHALLVGANFMIYKPVDLDHATRCMRAAYGTMLQERRRAARVSIDIPVTVRVSELGVIEARVSDLSVGGLALQCERALPIDREVSVAFSLPGTNGVVRVNGKVVNGNATGRTGVRFSFVPEEDLGLLESWLATELAKLENAEMPLGEARVAPDSEDTGVPGPSGSMTRPTDLVQESGEPNMTIADPQVTTRMEHGSSSSTTVPDSGRAGKTSRKQNGFSLIELLIVVAIILIIAAIAIPNLLRSRIAANEASAVASLRTINTAQISYYSNYPTVGFAAVLSRLSGTCTGTSVPSSAGSCMIDTTLASGTKSGYSFSVAGSTSGYAAWANPVSANQTGVNSFCSVQDAVVRKTGTSAITTCAGTETPLQ